MQMSEERTNVGLLSSDLFAGFDPGECNLMVMDGLMAAEMEACYYRSIVDGSWPDADSIIENLRGSG